MKHNSFLICPQLMLSFIITRGEFSELENQEADPFLGFSRISWTETVRLYFLCIAATKGRFVRLFRRQLTQADRDKLMRKLHQCCTAIWKAEALLHDLTLSLRQMYLSFISKFKVYLM